MQTASFLVRAMTQGSNGRELRGSDRTLGVDGCGLTSALRCPEMVLLGSLSYDPAEGFSVPFSDLNHLINI